MVLKEKQQITELMEEMHSIVNEQSKDHSINSPLNRSFDKRHQSNINNMQRKEPIEPIEIKGPQTDHTYKK